jgi:hypothetical protein
MDARLVDESGSDAGILMRKLLHLAADPVLLLLWR